METWNYNHDDLVALIDFMVAEGYEPSELAEAVRKPWKYADLLQKAQATPAAP